MEDNPLVKQAIQAALAGDWEQAMKANSKILAENPKDCEALNRLARACFELGNSSKAIDCYLKVLEFDPANVIASKNLKLLTKSNGGNGQKTTEIVAKNLCFDIFLTEPGRTKLVNLVNLATPVILSKLTCGEKVQIIFKKHQVIIGNFQAEYLGAVPDDLSHYLISLTKAGNNYEAYIKAVKTNLLTVIICERERSVKFANQPSFLSGKKTKGLRQSLSDSDHIPTVEFEEGFVELSEG